MPLTHALAFWNGLELAERAVVRTTAIKTASALSEFGSAMSEMNDELGAAIAMEAEASENLAAAKTEQERGGSGISMDLLLESIEKERDGLQLMQQAIESLRKAVEERRQGLDQQQQLLSELINSGGTT